MQAKKAGMAGDWRNALPKLPVRGTLQLYVKPALFKAFSPFHGCGKVSSSQHWQLQYFVRTLYVAPARTTVHAIRTV